MLSTAPTTTHRPGLATPAARLGTLVRWPFTNRFASPIWLAVRLYLGYMWFVMGLTKIGAGFLTGDPIGDILKLVGNGVLPVPVEAFRPVARLLVDLGASPLLSFSMPFLEMAIALSFVSGVLIVPAAVGAIFLNVTFVLSGIGQIQLDGRFIALQLLLILAFRIVGYIGVERLAVRILTATYTALRQRRTMRRAA
jgi:thiosulfate dehydrogenase [quinone] large subunit